MNIPVCFQYHRLPFLASDCALEREGDFGADFPGRNLRNLQMPGIAVDEPETVGHISEADPATAGVLRSSPGGFGKPADVRFVFRRQLSVMLDP